MNPHYKLPGDFIIRPEFARAILTETKATTLIQENFIPCTLDELNQFTGVSVEPLKYLFNNGFYYDDAREDFICQPLAKDRTDLISKSGYSIDQMTHIPSEFRWIKEEGESQIVLVLDRMIVKYYIDDEGRVQSSVSDKFGEDDTSVRLFQYDDQGVHCGCLTYHDGVDVVTYTGYGYMGHRKPRCRFRIKRDAWEFCFGNDAHDVTLADIKDNLRWDDFVERENLRVTQGIKEGDYLIARNRCDVRREILDGRQLDLWEYRDHKLVMWQSSSRLDPDGNYRPANFYFYEYDEQGRLRQQRFGGGAELIFTYEYDKQGRLTYMASYHDASQDNGRTSMGLVEYVRPI